MSTTTTHPPQVLQRIGGISSWLAGATFIIGIVLYVTIFSANTNPDQTPAEALQQLLTHETAMRWWYLITLVVFGILIVPLTWALHERLKPTAPTLTPIVSTFGCLWAGLVIAGGMISNVTITEVVTTAQRSHSEAADLLAASFNIVNGLTGGNEIVGSLWVTGLSIAAWRAKALPRQLCIFGVSTALAGFLTIVPAFAPLAMVYGLSMIGWFFWAGGVLFWKRP